MAWLAASQAIRAARMPTFDRLRRRLGIALGVSEADNVWPVMPIFESLFNNLYAEKRSLAFAIYTYSCDFVRFNTSSDFEFLISSKKLT